MPIYVVRLCQMLYKASAQTLILYGSEKFLVTGVMIKVLEGLCHRAARRIVGITARRAEDGELDYPPMADTMEDMGIWMINS